MTILSQGPAGIIICSYMAVSRSMASRQLAAGGMQVATASGRPGVGGRPTGGWRPASGRPAAPGASLAAAGQAAFLNIQAAWQDWPILVDQVDRPHDCVQLVKVRWSIQGASAAIIPWSLRLPQDTAQTHPRPPQGLPRRHPQSSPQIHPGTHSQLICHPYTDHLVLCWRGEMREALE